jgi:hypothetical protein
MRFLYHFLLIPISIALIACSSIHVRTDYDEEVDFSGYKTYLWLRIEKGKKPKFKNPLIERRIKRAVNAELTKKGLEIKKGGKPDLWITFHIGSRDKIDVTRYNYNPWKARHGRTVIVDRYKEGTLVIDIIDPQKKQLVWRGVATQTIQQGDVGGEVINEAVSKILNEYPPQI